MSSSEPRGTADLHVHSAWSDGAEGVRTILDHVADRTSLDVIAITDHDRIEGALQARRMAYAYPFDVVVGMEISSLHGHILALYIEEPIPAGLPAAETVARIHAQGGLAVAAHPCEPLSHGLMGLRGPRLQVGEVAALGLDAIEVINASLPSRLNDAGARALSRELGLPGMGGSDSHHPGTVGRAATCFAGRSAADLRRSIVRGEILPVGARWQVHQYVEHFYHRRLRNGWAMVRARVRVWPATLTP